MAPVLNVFLTPPDNDCVEKGMITMTHKGYHLSVVVVTHLGIVQLDGSTTKTTSHLNTDKKLCIQSI